MCGARLFTEDIAMMLQNQNLRETWHNNKELIKFIREKFILFFDTEFYNRYVLYYFFQSYTYERPSPFLKGVTGYVK